MAWAVLPVDSLLCTVLGISITVWFTLLLVFIIVPAVLGVSFGIRRIYMNALLKVFEVSVRLFSVLVHCYSFLTVIVSDIPTCRLISGRWLLPPPHPPQDAIQTHDVPP